MSTKQLIQVLETDVKVVGAIRRRAALFLMLALIVGYAGANIVGMRPDLATFVDQIWSLPGITMATVLMVAVSCFQVFQYNVFLRRLSAVVVLGLLVFWNPLIAAVTSFAPVTLGEFFSLAQGDIMCFTYGIAVGASANLLVWAGLLWARVIPVGLINLGVVILATAAAATAQTWFCPSPALFHALKSHASSFVALFLVNWIISGWLRQYYWNRYLRQTAGT